MFTARHLSVIRLGLLALLAAVLTGCGGGGSGGGGGGAVGGAFSVNLSAGNTSGSPNNAFSALSGAPLVTINSPPVVNFTVIDNGAVVTGLTASNARFIIAKLVPGANGDPDQWWSYTYRTETATAGVGPGGTPALASAKQATTDSGGTLTYNSVGYYTYTFGTDITDPANTNGVVFEPGKVHRVAIQLSYTDHNGDTVRINPYFDFTVDANGNAVAAQGRKMADVNNCNTCHNALALHGGGRVDTQYCVMCHNPGTTDANSGNVLELKTMVHNIHSGRRLASLANGAAFDYTIWGHQDSEHDYAEVGFPQDLRNCSKCHSASADTPEGDNWKTHPSKQACLTCHKTDATSNWYAVHITSLNLGTSVNDVDNSCIACHGAGKTWSAEQVHWNQNEENAATYKVNITGATYNSGTREVTVQYNVTNPTGGAKYDLTADCLAGPVCNDIDTVTAGSQNSRFYNLRFYLAYQNMPGWSSTSPTDFSSYNNGGSGANVYAYTGTNDGNNNYTAVISVPADTAAMIATGTARVISIGQAKEAELNVVTRNPIVPTNLINVSMQHTYKDVALSGTLSPRREIVADAKCNLCHGLLGTASGSNTLTEAFHSGARNSVIACALCHDANRYSSSTLMQDASGFNESYQFKRMIHGIHGGSKRTYDYYHGATNITAEVTYPGILSDCNTCHVTNTTTGLGAFESDGGVLGSSVGAGVDTVRGTVDDPVFSPKAASCSACHDSLGMQAHMTSVGGGVFGTKTQGELLSGAVYEACDGCHGPSGFVPVRSSHGVPVAEHP